MRRWALVLSLLAQVASLNFASLKAQIAPTKPADVRELKALVLQTLAPFGDPALDVTTEAKGAVDGFCKDLERINPTSNPATRGLANANGRWRVRYSDAPPPSNGALGPLRGAAFQTVDVRQKTYVNELSLFNGAVDIKLAADFVSSGNDSLRVSFRTLTATAFGFSFPRLNFAEGTERTWVLTYTDADVRIVRAGVDGGRSTARELGIIGRDAGQKRDSYLFFMTRESISES
ncbi:hypothetical protein M885DRAFT_525398 [Pelagophyceae sp. CCMP2097]|nr:hypothetical protein M885DRAFT_525398 [Pelagophyceae sp. CCMP2097]|mmetsp:Transcript_18359/g.63221  ORF Transcript_18359/g.63221 Transcript_18359/m.63221 type:complete len:233 (-) Transcript_18359:16-714(-)